LKFFVEPANILQPGQGGGRRGRCVGIDLQKVHFIQQEARRQGKRVYQVDVYFKNAFNAMSQAALWQVMTPGWLKFQMLTYWSEYMEAPRLDWPQTTRKVRQSSVT